MKKLYYIFVAAIFILSLAAEIRTILYMPQNRDIEGLKQMAEGGHHGAQRDLAGYYANAGIFSKDYVQAYKWYVIADVYECVDPKDDTMLSYYVTSHMTPEQITDGDRLVREWEILHPKKLEDDARAAELAKQIAAAENGDISEQRDLYEYYHSGITGRFQGVKCSLGNDPAKNNAEAVKWLKRAADRGSSWAQAGLGLNYLWGREGFPVDKVQAYARLTLGNDYHVNALKQSMTPEEMAAGEKLLNELRMNLQENIKNAYTPEAAALLKASENGDVEAENKLSIAYRDGKGVQQDAAESKKWRLKAKKNSNGEAQFLQGARYEYGRDVPIDKTEALKWYRAAAEKGWPAAQAKLGDFYMSGIAGLPADGVQAYMWYTLSTWDMDKTGIAMAEMPLRNLSKTLTADQIAQARHMADVWMQIHPQVSRTGVKY